MSGPELSPSKLLGNVQGGVEARNRNYAQIVKQLKFQRRKGLDLNEEPEERSHKWLDTATEADDSDSESVAPDELTVSEHVQVRKPI